MATSQQLKQAVEDWVATNKNDPYELDLLQEMTKQPEFGKEEFKCEGYSKKANTGEITEYKDLDGNNKQPIQTLHDAISASLRGLQDTNCRIINQYEMEKSNKENMKKTLEINHEMYKLFCHMLSSFDESVQSVSRTGSRDYGQVLKAFGEKLNVKCDENYGEDLSDLKKVGEKFLKTHLKERRLHEVKLNKEARAKVQADLIRRSRAMIESSKNLTKYLESYNTHFSPATAPYQLEILMPVSVDGDREAVKIDRNSGFYKFWKAIALSVGESGRYTFNRIRQILCGDMMEEEKEVNPMYIGVSKELFDRITYECQRLAKDTDGNNYEAQVKNGQLQLPVYEFNGDKAVARMKARVERCSDRESSNIRIWRVAIYGKGDATYPVKDKSSDDSDET